MPPRNQSRGDESVPDEHQSDERGWRCNLLDDAPDPQQDDHDGLWKSIWHITHRQSGSPGWWGIVHCFEWHSGQSTSPRQGFHIQSEWNW